MDTKIIFSITTAQKNKLKEEAELRGLLLGSFCRMILIKEIKNANK
jgi:hypothetical protein|tara:strand:+ start:474 stop:611 length:138 start_codon:yes stop_codon:yes gene_type:complete